MAIQDNTEVLRDNLDEIHQEASIRWCITALKRAVLRILDCFEEFIDIIKEVRQEQKSLEDRLSQLEIENQPIGSNRDREIL